jgi:thiol-disulfide isomerase/thioredoxin
MFKFKLMRMRHLIGAIILLMTSGCSFGDKGGRYEEPMLHVLNLEGERTAVGDMFQKPLILHFWATWCPVCRQEMVKLARLGRESGKGRNLPLAAIAIDDTPENVKAFLKSIQFPYTVYIDNENEVRDYFKVVGIPATLFFKERLQGNKVYMQSGVLTNRVHGEVLWDGYEMNRVLGEYNK